MEVFTDQPGLHFYSGNFIRGKVKRKADEFDYYHSFFAVRIRHYNDLTTQPGFPMTMLRPGQVYRSVCCFQFKN